MLSLTQGWLLACSHVWGLPHPNLSREDSGEASACSSLEYVAKPSTWALTYLCTYSLSLCDACPLTLLTRRAELKSSPPSPWSMSGLQTCIVYTLPPRASAEKCAVQLCDSMGRGQPRFGAGCKPLRGLFSQV